MGYRKSLALSEIAIPLKINVNNEIDNTLTTLNVTHIFTIPPNFTEIREEYNRRLVHSKGRRVITHASSALWYLWLNTVKRVEGYDDLPDSNGWKAYFESPMERIHAENAANRLMELMETEEMETEKKPVQLSEP